MRCLLSEKEAGEIKVRTANREMETVFSEAEAGVFLNEHTRHYKATLPAISA